MVYALEMFLDEPSERRILSHYNDIKNLGISSYLLDVNSLPHITIGVFNDIDVAKEEQVLEDFCRKQAQFEVVFSNLGVFTHPKPCVFIAPVVTDKLLTLHRELHELFKLCSTEGFNFYLPDMWVPHLAVDISQDGAVISKSTDYLISSFKPFIAQVTNIGWVEIAKPVKRLNRFYLKK